MLRMHGKEIQQGEKLLSASLLLQDLELSVSVMGGKKSPIHVSVF